MADHRGEASSKRAWLGFALGAAFLAACTGTIGDLGQSEGNGPGGPRRPGANPGDPGPNGTGDGGTRPPGYGDEVDPLDVRFTCNPAADPSPSPLKRLTVRQYENSLRDLLAGAPGVVDEASAEMAQLPIDGEEEASFAKMDSRLSQRHVDGFYAVADRVSHAIVDDGARLSGVAGACATAGAVDVECLRAFVRDFGRRVWRRPLTSSEIDRYLALNEPGVVAGEVYRGVLFSFLLAPQFLYHFETEGTDIAGRDEYLDLGPYEVASRLSYHFLQSTPDDALDAAAADGSLVTDAGYRAQVERLFDDPRTEQAVREFYADWYHLDSFGGFATTPAFATFATGVAANGALYDAAVDEVEAMIRHFTYDTAGLYRDLLTTNLVFTESPALAALYGVAPWDGTSPPSSFPEGQRAGILTRAAMLISTNHTTNPFKRGAFLRRSILCTPVKPPAMLPAEALTPPPFDPNASTRDRFARKVEQEPCATCHASFMPYGFALEAYDGLGRYRTDERIIDDDGNVVATVPIVTGVAAEVGTKDPVQVAGPIELSQALADSGLAEECFARQYFRYTFRRDEGVGDECVLTSVLDAVQKGSLRAALRDIALTPAFRRRVVE